MINIIVAYDKKRGIGKDNSLCWRQSKDLSRFKQLTTGHTVVMGRKTFESIGRPLPNRRNIVITRQNLEIPQVEIINDINNIKQIKGEVFIIGGGEIYKNCLILADRIFATEIDCEIDADTYFTEINDEDWTIDFKEFHNKDEKNEYNYTFINYARTR
jgi:dihydrofolate reductase